MHVRDSWFVYATPQQGLAFYANKGLHIVSHTIIVTFIWPCSDDDGGSDSSVSDGLPVNIEYMQKQVLRLWFISKLQRPAIMVSLMSTYILAKFSEKEENDKKTERWGTQGYCSSGTDNSKCCCDAAR